MEECVTILAELISEDCRFRVKTPRLRKPPNALQAVCLDFAQCLITNQLHDPKVVADIGFAVLPAFSTFPKEMQPRLLRFFEESVLRGMLESLGQARGVRGMPLESSLQGVHCMWTD